MKIHDSYLGRRRFLCGMIGGSTAALGTSVGVPLVTYVGNLRETPPPEWMEIDKADFELAPGTSKKIKYGPITALIINTPEGELKVFDATCTHLACKVNYHGEENHIFCPCHKGYFDVDGGPVSGPPERPLRKFAYRFRDGKLVIALEKEDLEKAF